MLSVIGVFLIFFSVYIISIVSKDSSERGHSLFVQAFTFISIIVSILIFYYIIIYLAK